MIKGGSHLCAPNYCRRYRPAARHAAAGRHVDQPCRISLRHQREERPHEQRSIEGQAPTSFSAERRRHRSGATCCSARTSLVAASALTAAGLVTTAQAQQPAAPRNRPAGKPEHPRHLRRRHRHREHQRLLERPDGLRDAEHRPHRPRGHQVPALLRRAVLHRRPRGVPHRPARHSHRPDQGRLPRRADGHEPARSLDRRPAQEPRLCHRPVRQEPCRRPQRIAADGERLR